MKTAFRSDLRGVARKRNRKKFRTKLGLPCLGLRSQLALWKRVHRKSRSCRSMTNSSRPEKLVPLSSTCRRRRSQNSPSHNIIILKDTRIRRGWEVDITGITKGPSESANFMRSSGRRILIQLVSNTKRPQSTTAQRDSPKDIKVHTGRRLLIHPSIPTTFSQTSGRNTKSHRRDTTIHQAPKWKTTEPSTPSCTSRRLGAPKTPNRLQRMCRTNILNHNILDLTSGLIPITNSCAWKKCEG